jgi:hypothetical protein
MAGLVQRFAADAGPCGTLAGRLPVGAQRNAPSAAVCLQVRPPSAALKCGLQVRPPSAASKCGRQVRPASAARPRRVAGAGGSVFRRLSATGTGTFFGGLDAEMLEFLARFERRGKPARL